MTPSCLFDLIQEMRQKKAMFAHFVGFVDFNFPFTRTVFKTELIRSYGAFLDALDAAIDDYNEAENQTPKLIFELGEEAQKTVVWKGQLAPKEKGDYDRAMAQEKGNPCPFCDLAQQEGNTECRFCGKQF